MTWTRQRLEGPPPARPANYRKHHVSAVWDAVAAGVLSREAASYHLAVIDMSNDSCDDLDWVTLKRVAVRMAASVRSVSRWRAEVVDKGFEAHEHRCVVRPDGTVRGIPNRIRFALPDKAAAKVKDMISRPRRPAKAGGKGRATRKAPQNDPDHNLGQIEGRRRAEAVAAALSAGLVCTAPGCMYGLLDNDRTCKVCSGHGVDPAVMADIVGASP